MRTNFQERPSSSRKPVEDFSGFEMFLEERRAQREARDRMIRARVRVFTGIARALVLVAVLAFDLWVYSILRNYS